MRNEANSIKLASNFIKAFHPWLWSRKFSKIANPDHALTKSLISQSKALLDSGITFDTCLEAITKVAKSGVKLQHVNQLANYIEKKTPKNVRNVLTSQKDIIHNLAYTDGILKDILKVEEVFDYAGGVFNCLPEKRYLESIYRLITNYSLDQVLFSIDILKEKGIKVDKPLFIKRYFDDAELRRKHALSLRQAAMTTGKDNKVGAKRGNRLSWDDQTS